MQATEIKELTRFNLVNTPTGIEFFDSNKVRDSKINGITFLIIGTNGSNNFCLNTLDGSVWLADDENVHSFINSNLSQFIQCLAEHSKLFHGQKLTDEEMYQASLELRRKVQSIDAKAMEEDTFWYWITEEQIEIYEAWNDE